MIVTAIKKVSSEMSRFPQAIKHTPCTIMQRDLICTYYADCLIRVASTVPRQMCIVYT